MEEQLWLRSPVAGDTLRRAIERYSRFLQLLRLYPDTTLVPPLDIDLVWHTHQCSPSQYRSDSIQLTGRFINHSDRIDDSMLRSGMNTTRDLYRIRFGQEYVLCHCWDCETVLSMVGRLMRDGGDPEELDLISRRVEYEVTYNRAVELVRRQKKPLQVRNLDV
ncbi:hypothetical protein VTN00DRAFT_2805 [Thermoascus crustaceus]|uniref:uncharacterized protein n=1 Tax=Thermoascus crustaceus TaxID=5088 RepID=UPI00374327E6